MKDSSSLFPFGLRVILRSTRADDSTLHFVDFPLAREVERENNMDEFLRLLDADKNFIAIVAVDSISLIVPLIVEGPSDAKDQS